jgi:hypothetical protein
MLTEQFDRRRDVKETQNLTGSEDIALKPNQLRTMFKHQRPPLTRQDNSHGHERWHGEAIPERLKAPGKTNPGWVIT